MPRKGEKTALANPDFPTEEQIRAWGDILFLAMRSPRHGAMTAYQLREAFEPAVTTGQYRIFRFDGIARGLITYAFLGYNAEYRYLSGKVLKARDWRSGRQLWITDIIAPYPGLTQAMSRWVMTRGHLTSHNFYFRRVSGAKATRKIVHVDFEREDKLGVVLSPKDFGLVA